MPAKIKKIYGPPGTGKTWTITSELIKLKSLGLDVERVFATAYTRAAVRALYLRLVKDDIIPSRNIKTWHSHLWRAYGLGNKFASPQWWKSFFESLGIDYNPAFDSEEENLSTISWLPEGNRLKQAWNLALMRGTPEEWKKGGIEKLLNDYVPIEELKDLSLSFAARVFRGFLDKSKRDGVRDYMHAILYFIDNPGPGLNLFPDEEQAEILIVDEAQDISPLMAYWIKSIYENNIAKEIWLVGDDDQAILEFIGADAKQLNSFEANETKVLTTTYRFGSNLAKSALKWIEKIPPSERIQKEYKAKDENIETEIYVAISPVEAAIVAALQGDSVLLLNRHRDGVLTYSNALKKLGYRHQKINSPRQVPFPKDTKEFVFQAIVGLLDKTFKWHLSPAGLVWIADHVLEDSNLAEKVRKRWLSEQYWPTRKEVLTEYPPFEEVPTLVLQGYLPQRYQEWIEKYKWIWPLKKFPPLISIGTIHSSKGLEADTVVLDTNVTRRVLEAIKIGDYSEIRVWYVGITRAKKRLIITGNDFPGLKAYLGEVKTFDGKEVLP